MVLASWEVEVGGSRFEAGLGKNKRHYLKKLSKTKGMVAWLNW
jgi:hypothetical protein